jgi:PKHD-type hydroxylase
MSISNLLQTNDFVQRNQAKALAAKWEKTGLLEGLKGETEKAGMAQLLENQARQLVKEATSTGTTAGSEEWAGVALPLVRRIFAEFAAKEFVSVQPMNLPSGLIFYLDFKYGTAHPGFDNDNLNRTGDPFGNPNATDSMFGVTTTGSDAAGGLYGAGRFGYSINNTSSVGLGSTAANTGSGTGAINTEIRNVERVMLPVYKDIGGRLAAAGFAANNRAWKFAVTHANQGEFLKYPAGGRYTAHMDTFLNPEGECRKLTVLAFLNDDFEGGRFFIQDGHERYYPPQKKGTVLVFPSFLVHGVEDVTAGMRYSAVCWLVGPFFK